VAYSDIERGKALLHGGCMSKTGLCVVVNGEITKPAKLEKRHVGSSNTAVATRPSDCHFETVRMNQNDSGRGRRQGRCRNYVSEFDVLRPAATNKASKLKGAIQRMNIKKETR
jgi:hypothetical protein